MRFGILLGVGLLSCAAVGAVDKVQPLNVKPGLWESAITTVRTGPPPTSAEALAKMAPDQRARAEQMMKMMQAPQKRTVSQCVTREDLARSFGGYAENPSCKRTVVSSTASQQEFRIECTNKGILSTGTVSMQAIDFEHVSGAIKMTMNYENHLRTMTMTINARWLGAACSTAK
jgi:hypothetical protein